MTALRRGRSNAHRWRLRRGRLALASEIRPEALRAAIGEYSDLLGDLIAREEAARER